MGSGGLPRTKTVEVVQMATGNRGTNIVRIVVAIVVFGRLEDWFQANGAGMCLVRGHLQNPCIGAQVSLDSFRSFPKNSLKFD